MRYIKSFANDAAIQDAVNDGVLGKPYVALDEQNGLIDWDRKVKDYSKMYFTIEALEDGNLTVRYALSYSINNGEWVSITQAPTTISLNAGDKVRFKGNYGPVEAFTGNTISSIVYGNIMSLIYGDNYTTATTLGSSKFNSLFQNYSGLTSSENLILPATALTTTCYLSMFQRCVNMEVGPVLSASTLVENCYMHLFYDCWKLKRIVCLATSNLNSQEDWVYGIPNKGTFVKSPDATGWVVSQYKGIPSGWTVVDAS